MKILQKMILILNVQINKINYNIKYHKKKNNLKRYFRNIKMIY